MPRATSESSTVGPETGLHEFGCGAASAEHAGGTPGLDKLCHKFHRVPGGYVSMEVSRAGGVSALRLRHRDVHGATVHAHTFSRKAGRHRVEGCWRRVFAPPPRLARHAPRPMQAAAAERRSPAPGGDSERRRADCDSIARCRLESVANAWPSPEISRCRCLSRAAQRRAQYWPSPQAFTAMNLKAFARSFDMFHSLDTAANLAVPVVKPPAHRACQRAHPADAVHVLRGDHLQKMRLSHALRAAPAPWR